MTDEKKQEYNDPDCRASSKGHQPFCHSVTCRYYRGNQKGETAIGLLTESDSSYEVSKAASPIPAQRKHSSHIAAIHEEHEDVHRHHSAGFHTNPHIAEHLAAAAGRDFADIKAKAAGRQSRISIQVDSDTEAKATDQQRNWIQERPVSRSIRHLIPLTPVHAVTQLSAYEYHERPTTAGHPTHRERKETKEDIVFKLGPSLQATPAHSQDLRTLRHVNSGIFDKSGVGNESPQSTKQWATINSTTPAGDQESNERLDHHDRNARHAYNPTIKDTLSHDSRRNQVDHKIRRFESAEFWKKATEDRSYYKGNDEIQKQRDQAEHKSSAAANKISCWRQEISEEKQTKSRNKKAIGTERHKHAVPSARVSSPPEWLKHPQKEPDQSWMYQKLRHVSSQNPHDAWRSHQPEVLQPPRRVESTVHDGGEHIQLPTSTPLVERAKRLEESVTSSRWGEESINRIQETSKTEKKTGTEEWAEHLGIKADWCSSQTQRSANAHNVGEDTRPSVPGSTSSALRTAFRKTQNEERHRSDEEVAATALPHAAVNVPESAQAGHPTTTSIDEAGEYPEEYCRQSQHRQERYHEATVKAEAELNRLRVEKDRVRRGNLAEAPPSSKVTASGFSSPSQILEPGQFLSRNRRQETTSESHTSGFMSGQKEAFRRTNKPSDLDLHRPSAVVPSNHVCSWKERYVALTAQIRELEAELSLKNHYEKIETETRHQDTIMGIEGLTIVMHLKDKDDLVINTDLTQEAEE